MNLHLANLLLLHLEGDHDRRDDLVADLGGILHVASNDMNCVPSSGLSLSRLIHDLLNQETGIETLRVVVVDVNRGCREVVVQLHVSREDFVCLLFKLQKLL